MDKQTFTPPEDAKKTDSCETKKDWSSHVFVQPKKCIVSLEDLEKWKKSKTYETLMIFLADCQQAVKSKQISATPASSKFEKIVSLLNDFDLLVDQIPPLKQPMRFGNKAFKTWHEASQKKVDDFLRDLLPEEMQRAAVELKTYLSDSFGSFERIDYGTGHELAFMLFLLCLRELGLFQKEDYEALLRHVFYRYIKLMRKLQLTYMLEPAGSHGVWGLDDYHFLPFLFGAAELIKSELVPRPEDIHREKLLNDYAEEYIYLSCIKFIKEVKKNAPFQETSPILNDISGSPNWEKVATGMVKMYQGEVLLKHPVIKHMFFGSLIPY